MPGTEEMLYFKFFSFSKSIFINIYTDVVRQKIVIFKSSTHFFVACTYLIMLQNRKTAIRLTFLDAFRSFLVAAC